MENGAQEGSIPDEDEQVPNEERGKLEKVMQGSLDDLPPLGSKIVRIFTSSTFTGGFVNQAQNKYFCIKLLFRKQNFLHVQASSYVFCLPTRR